MAGMFFGWRVVAAAFAVAVFAYGNAVYGPGVWLHALTAGGCALLTAHTNADRAPGDGAEVTRSLIRASLADSFASDVTAGTEQVGGVHTVVIRVRARLPVIGLLGPARRLSVQGHALQEAL